MGFNIIEWMITEKYASNNFQANHIASGLKLASIHNDPELQRERVILYRGWRPKTDEKNQLPTDQAYALAIAGIRREDVEDRQIDFMKGDAE